MEAKLHLTYTVIKSLSNISTEVRSEVYQTIQPGVKYVDDPTLPVGQTQQVQAPSTGYKVKVTKKTTQNGKVIVKML